MHSFKNEYKVFPADPFGKQTDPNEIIRAKDYSSCCMRLCCDVDNRTFEFNFIKSGNWT